MNQLLESLIVGLVPRDGPVRLTSPVMLGGPLSSYSRDSDGFNREAFASYSTKFL